MLSISNKHGPLNRNNSVVTIETSPIVYIYTAVVVQNFKHHDVKKCNLQNFCEKTKELAQADKLISDVVIRSQTFCQFWCDIPFVQSTLNSEVGYSLA